MRHALLLLFIAASALAQQPRIDSVTPSQGPIAGGTLIAISGANFSAATVKIDRVAIRAVTQSDSTVTLLMPPHDNGYAVITIESASGIASAEYLYVPPRLEDLPPGFITTVVGVGTYVRTFGAANRVPVQPDGIVFDTSGNVYVAEAAQHRVTRIGVDGDIHEFAGGNFFVGDQAPENVPAVGGGVSYPFGVAVGPGGKIYIGSHSPVLRVVDPQTGLISNAAGNNTAGFSGDGGPAHDARIGQATWVAADASNVYFIDWDNTRVRRIDAGGRISTFAGNGTVGYSGDGGPATSASLNFGVSDFGALALDPQGNLFIGESQNGVIRKVDRGSGIITTFAPHVGDVRSLAVDRDGNVYYGTGGKIVKLSGKGEFLAAWGSGNYGLTEDGPITASLRVGHIVGLAIDANGNIVFADDWAPRVRRINLQTNRLETIGGIYPAYPNENGPALAAPLMNDYLDIAFDHAGNLLVGDGRLRRVDGSGMIQTIAGATPGACCADDVPAQLMANGCIAIDVNRDDGIDVGEPGNIGHVDTAAIYHRLGPLDGSCGYDGDGGPFKKSHLCQPWDTARDSAGNLYIADTNNNRIRRVDGKSGIITTFAGNGGPVNGLERYGEGKACGDGGPAIDACLNTPFNLTIDPDDNFYVSDGGGEIRRIDRNGTIAPYAALGNTQKMSFDRGFLYTSQIAGVLRVDHSGSVTPLAGIGESGFGGNAGFSGDGGPALAARVTGGAPAVDRDGNLFFVDGSRRIRAVRYGAVLAPPNASVSAAASGSTITVSVLDAVGHPAPSVRVDFSVPSSGASCSAPFAITDANGVATTTCTPNCVAGTYSVTATPLTSSATATVAMTNSGRCHPRAARH